MPDTATTIELDAYDRDLVKALPGRVAILSEALRKRHPMEKKVDRDSFTEKRLRRLAEAGLVAARREDKFTIWQRTTKPL